jgi:hypothetical protein
LSKEEGEKKEYYERGIEAYKKILEHKPYDYETSRLLGAAYSLLADLLTEEEDQE